MAANKRIVKTFYWFIAAIAQEPWSGPSIFTNFTQNYPSTKANYGKSLHFSGTN